MFVTFTEQHELSGTKASGSLCDSLTSLHRKEEGARGEGDGVRGVGKGRDTLSNAHHTLHEEHVSCP